VRLVALSADPFRGETRILGPLAEWLRRGVMHATYYTINVDAVGLLPFNREIVVLLAGGYGLDQAGIAACRNAGMRMVHDMSEPVWLLPGTTVSRPDFYDEERLRVSMNACAIVTAPSEAQAAAIRAFGVRVPIAIVPSAPDPDAWRSQPPRAPRTRLRVGWVGLPGAHDDDLALLESIVGGTDHLVDWIFFGHAPPALRERARAEHRFQSRVEPVLYPTILAQLDLDVIAVVRGDSPYNRTKDDLIVRQAACLGYAVVASDRPALAGLPIPRIPDDPAAWAQILGAFAHHPERLREAAATLGAAIDAAADYQRMCAAAFAAWTGTS